MTCAGASSPKMIESVYRKHAQMQGSRFINFHEEEVRDAFLAINHYRFIDAKDIRNKCDRNSTAFVVRPPRARVRARRARPALD